jgi:imidazole glycerol-phosphate synthase subunit HisF
VLRPRLIPCLSIIKRGLFKTINFSRPRYLGDPINTVKIFNNKGVDEICILDIRATSENRPPDLEYLKDIASEAFMPLSYGGGITNLSEIEKLFSLGYEKVVINTSFARNPCFIKEAVNLAGSQSIVISIDVKSEFGRRWYCYINDGLTKIKDGPVIMAKKAEDMGAGELLLNSMTFDGTMQGYDIELVQQITSAVSIPVVACGGAKDIMDFKNVIEIGGAHAAAAGSLYVYYGKHKAVLITAPEEKELFEIGLYKNA